MKLATLCRLMKYKLFELLFACTQHGPKNLQRQFYTMLCGLLPGLAEIYFNEKQNKQRIHEEEKSTTCCGI
jgi:hypothetical protein